MESYIVRIYRHDAEQVSGLVINAADGAEHAFQNLQQLGQRLDLGNDCDKQTNKPVTNSPSSDNIK